MAVMSLVDDDEEEASPCKKQKREQTPPPPPSMHIPMDLVIQILSKLPIKSLIRFRSVCKSWSALVHDPDFIRLYHTSQKSTSPSLVIQLHGCDVLYVDTLSTNNSSIFSLTFLNDPAIRIRASNNGLLCCQSLTKPRGVYYVCNPLTRQFRLLPPPPPMCRAPSDVGLAVTSTTTTNSASYRFRVLLAGYMDPQLPRNHILCLLFDSETNSWNRIVVSDTDTRSRREFNDNKVQEQFSTQVVSSGDSMYWLPHVPAYVLALDLESLVPRKIPLPKDLSDDPYTPPEYFGVDLTDLDGSVSLTRVSGNDAWTRVWVLKDGDKWDLVNRGQTKCLERKVVQHISQSTDTMLAAWHQEVAAYDWKRNAWKRITAPAAPAACCGEPSRWTCPPVYFYALSFRRTLFPCQ